MKTNKLDKKANTIAMQLGKEATFPADRVIETSIKEHNQTFFKDIQTENSDISFIPPWETGLLRIRHPRAVFFFLWSAEPKEEDILYTIDLYHKTGEKPMMYEFGVEYITSQRRSDLLIEGDVITIRTPYAIALERTNRKKDIEPFLREYMDDVFGDILAAFFRAIAWFNYLMEHPDRKQIKKNALRRQYERPPYHSRCTDIKKDPLQADPACLHLVDRLRPLPTLQKRKNRIYQALLKG